MDQWFDRLVEEIDRSGKSLRSISRDAKCGENYVQQMIRDKKDPGTDRLMRILKVLGEESAMYVLTSVRMADGDGEFFRAAANLDPDVRREAMHFFEMMQAREGKSKPLSAPYE